MTLSIRSADFVGSLCLALAHRWEPERLFVFVYTGYLDESGTHEGSPITVMGGLLARVDQWERFQDRFDQIKKKHAFRIFHTKKFKKRSGDFRGWNTEQSLNLMNDLAGVTTTGLTDGVAVALDNETYEKIYRGDGKPNKARLDSAYGVCFRTCLNYFVLEAAKRKHRGKIPDLHIVLEAGHRNSGDAERIFFEVKKDFEKIGATMLRTFTLAEKDECDPLMMADFIAHSTFMIKQNAKRMNRPTPPSQHIPRGQTGITYLESTPEGIANLRQLTMARVRGRKKS